MPKKTRFECYQSQSDLTQPRQWIIFGSEQTIKGFFSGITARPPLGLLDKSTRSRLVRLGRPSFCMRFKVLSSRSEFWDIPGVYQFRLFPEQARRIDRQRSHGSQATDAFSLDPTFV